MARFPEVQWVYLEPAPRASGFTPHQRFVLLMVSVWVSPWSAALILGVTR